MKKSTLVVVLLAVLIGGLTWYFEIKHPRKPADTDATDVHTPAFTFPAANITYLEIDRQGQTIKIERRGDGWQITQPGDTRADKFAANELANALAAATIERKFPVQPDKLSLYGLAQPEVVVRVHLKDGSQHEVKLGGKDFDNADVYARVDNSPDVYLFTASVLTSADNGVDKFRDNSVLDVQSPDVIAVALKDSQGDFLVARTANDWQIKKPSEGRADTSQIMGMLAQVSSSRMGTVTQESADNLGKYGLQSPALTFTAVDKGAKSHTLLVGNKTGDNYFAQDTSRSMIFEIPEALFKRLNIGMAELRSKGLVNVSQSDLTKVEIRNANQTLVASRQGDKWIISEPKAQAGKEAMPARFLTPLTNAQATEILDKPAAAITARLAQPAVDVTLADKSGKTIHVALSQPDGDSVYAKTSTGPEIYKLSKQTLDDLNFQAGGIVAGADK
jgi:hypothetical protein